jgi:hypothetical protein
MLVLVMASESLIVCVGYRDRATVLRSVLREWTIVAAVAAAVAAPFYLPLAWRYGFDVRNPVPMAWASWYPREELLPLSLILLVLVGIVWRDRARIGARLVLLWFCLSSLLLAYGRIAQSTHLPAFLPLHHAHLFLRASEIAVTGIGISWAARRIRDRARAWQPVRRLAAGHGAGFRIATWGTLVAAGLVLFGWPRAGFYYRPLLRQEAQTAGRWLARAQAVEWIRTSTPRDAVILATSALGLQLVGPAGRACVVVPPQFSNPYVDWRPRQRDARRMLRAIAEGDEERFRGIARYYNVTYVVLRADSRPTQALVPWLVLEWQQADICVFRVIHDARGDRRARFEAARRRKEGRPRGRVAAPKSP